MERGLVARVFVVDKDDTAALMVKMNTTASVLAAIVVF